jgi:hypothetical protein
MRAPKKEVTFQNRNCRVGKLDPLSALWIVSILQSAQLVASKKLTLSSNGGGVDTSSTPSGPPTVDQVGDMIAVSWAMAGLGLQEDEQRRAQQLCLATCEVKSGTSNMFEPVITADGRWVQDDVADNLKLVNFLVIETLKYNLTSFFLEGASEAARPSLVSAPFVAS